MAATPEPDPEDQTGEQAGHKADDAVERQGRTNVTNPDEEAHRDIGRKVGYGNRPLARRVRDECPSPE